MNGGILDILIFAMIAAFLVFRLRSVLGRRTGHERRRNDEIFRPREETARSGEQGSSDNVVALPDRSNGEDAAAAGDSGLTQVKVADPSFEEQSFLQGARAAFEMIVTAFANGDRDTLRALTAGEVYEDLITALDEREARGHVLETTLVGIKRAEIVDAGMQGSEARVVVRFESEQVNVTRDAEGQTIAGSENVVDEATDIWTFARDTRQGDPNWALVETRDPE